MPGRQAHGRPAGVANNSGSGKSKSKSKSNGKKRSEAKARDAFAIASAMYADGPRMTPRNRELDVPQEGPRRGKHARDDDDNDEDDRDEDDDEEDNGRPPRKVRRGPDAGEQGEDQGEDVEYGSDSSGNEWRFGGDDSEIDSDDAFGESDEERFEGYTFRGSSKKKKDPNEVREGRLALAVWRFFLLMRFLG